MKGGGGVSHFKQILPFHVKPSLGKKQMKIPHLIMAKVFVKDHISIKGGGLEQIDDVR